METSEKIVEAYLRYIKGYATIPNIRCKGGFEIDLLAVHPKTKKKLHIEISVSVSASFHRLKWDSESYIGTLKNYLKKKFNNPNVLAVLEEYGFEKAQKVVVTRGWYEDTEKKAEKHNIKLWRFYDIINELAIEFEKEKKYFTDDTLRTLQLFTQIKS